ncbi:type I restriction-modification system subunit M [Sulfurihydrogenibium yellowstonense]|uniref:site-specific DNA-methyltransferase (adenine-specific) n=1 Tax=Sulfurihydrogenibium yellowstonense SS-5 TaxID=432331 RepID=C4FIV9_9AQUI|nr:class I SAM-dependent DNA methyltransferase [Sulfurihydrogenibium yellowstonense]EEP60984.1 type I restriction-modification system, M subunit [Sulfurihydrogenibium yellowstonense SS-5]
MAKKTKVKNNEPLEAKLWKAADTLRKNIDAAEYKHVVLGLVFLKYISDAFEKLYEELKKDPYADPEDKDEYLAKNVFYIPEKARWSEIKKHAKNPEIGKILDEAMDEIERENPQLKGVLPKVYSKGNIDPLSLGGLIDLFDNIELEAVKEKSADILGYVFEYFLGQFALAEGKKGGQFYTPKSVVELLVEMIQPFKGRVFDPCCGSGGMFVQSEKFVLAHQGKIDDISIYGQESNQTTWKLCKMNLAIRHIDSSQVKWNSEGSLLNDAHKDLKADYILANPPFNQKEWGREYLENDPRWQYGIPPAGNANYAWIQHFIYHLSNKGKAGFVLAKISLTSKQKEEYEIRKNLIEADLVECIVNLPGKLFLNAPIPVCLWFINKNKKRKGQILFIDARDMGELINRRLRVLRPEDIRKIADTYHEWQKGSDGNYQDIVGFCKSASLEEVRNLDYALAPGRYVGLPEEEDDFDFVERFNKLKAEFEEQIKEEERFNKLILENLARLDLEG